MTRSLPNTCVCALALTGVVFDSPISGRYQVRQISCWKAAGTGSIVVYSMSSTEGEEANHGEAPDELVNGSTKNGSSKPATTITNNLEIGDDEEVRLALEMAMAAAQNPHLTPEELRKLVGQKNRQLQIVTEVEQEKQKRAALEAQKQQEEAQKRWTEKKQTALNWWNERSSQIAQSAAELKWEAEKQFYAEDIKQDSEIITTRKQMKAIRKVIKAHRLQGNRVETRHTFKRQRAEKLLIAIQEKIRKQQKLLVGSSFNVAEYAKAMLKATKKWKKKAGKEELSLEAQLCRNMHQMLAIEKQKAKLHKNHRDIKKYLQRCKSWLTDKKAFCEMHIMTLEATAMSMRIIYEDTLAKQDQLIRRLRVLDEFDGIDLDKVEVPGEFNMLERAPGPSAILNALRGLPINDSVRMKKDDGDKRNHSTPSASAPETAPGGNRPELVIDIVDDSSVSSHLTDPDSGLKEPVILSERDLENDDESEDNFGHDAPWKSGTSATEVDGGHDAVEGKVPSDKLGNEHKGIEAKKQAGTKQVSEKKRKDEPKDMVQTHSEILDNDQATTELHDSPAGNGGQTDLCEKGDIDIVES